MVPPLVHIAADRQVRPTGWKYPVTPAVLVPMEGHAWVGRALIFGEGARQAATLIVVWGPGQKERWVLLTTLPPAAVPQRWYGLLHTDRTYAVE